MITLEEVYAWFNRYGTSHIHPSSVSLIDQMLTALHEGRTDETRGLLQQLKDLACKLRDDEEVTEILTECGIITYGMGSLEEAETILVDTATRVWSNLHKRAVIQWMVGCVQWRSMPARQRAVISWRNSLSDFEKLARQPGLSDEQQTWYQETCARLEQSLIEALELVGSYIDLVQSSGGEGGGYHPPAEELSATPVLSGSAVPQTFDILQLFTISEEIPAGDFGPSGTDPFPIGTVEIDRLIINDHYYRIHSTRGRRIINLPLDQKYTVVKVKGDSMNQENITDEDFVLLRRVDMPANGDIVMAEIVGIDSQATLKRYIKNNDTITLQPKSNNPVHKPFIFKKVDEGFYIRGVVVAVLKLID